MAAGDADTASLTADTCRSQGCVLSCFVWRAGQERFRALTSTFYRGAVGIIFGEWPSCIAMLLTPRLHLRPLSLSTPAHLSHDQCSAHSVGGDAQM